MKLLVSACLLGVLCRYDGKAKTHEGVCSLLEKHTMIPFCPEIYGGLSTPRSASERLGERVVAKIRAGMRRNSSAVGRKKRCACAGCTAVRRPC